MTCLVGMLAAGPAIANIGLPMIAVFLPPLWAALVPIVIVESAVVSNLVEIPFPRAVGAVALANVVSTIVGVPLLWFLLAIVELLCCGSAMGLGNIWARIYAVTVQAPWLLPYEKELGWMVPSALCTLAVIFMAMSVLVEAPIVSRLTRADTRRIWRSMWAANLGSYGLLGIAGVAVGLFGVKLDRLHQAFAPLSELAIEAVFHIARFLAKGEP